MKVISASKIQISQSYKAQCQNTDFMSPNYELKSQSIRCSQIDATFFKQILVSRSKLWDSTSKSWLYSKCVPQKWGLKVEKRWRTIKTNNVTLACSMKC